MYNRFSRLFDESALLVLSLYRDQMSFVLTFERQKSKSKHIDIKEQNNLYLNHWNEKKHFLYSLKILFFVVKSTVTKLLTVQYILWITVRMDSRPHSSCFGENMLLISDFPIPFPQPLATTTPFIDTWIWLIWIWAHFKNFNQNWNLKKLRQYKCILKWDEITPIILVLCAIF